MADVFVSYKKEDRRLAETVVEALEAQGFSVWWDQDITPRESWDGMIQREAETAKALVVLWTPRSIASEWVRAEAAFGRSRNKLIPMTMEPCQLPIAFSLVQSADLTRSRGQADSPEWQRAVAWISEQCQKPVATAVTPAKGRLRWGWIAAGVALVAVGAIAAVLLLQPKPEAGVAGGETLPPPLPEGPMGEVEAARRAFLAEPSAPECELSFNVVYTQGAEVDPASLAAGEAEMDKIANCEKSDILLEGHADAAEADPFGVARARVEDLAMNAPWLPTWGVGQTSLGSEELAVKTVAGISLKANRRVEVKLRGLPREQVREAAYKALGLADPKDRSQPFARILFGDDRVTLDQADTISRQVIETWRDILAENPAVKIQVVGTVEDQMTREYALALGQRRANAIVDYLTSIGADRSRIYSLSYGKDRPAEIKGDQPLVVTRMANRSAYIEIVE